MLKFGRHWSLDILPMLLSTLLSALPDATLVGPREAEIAGIAYDSRALERGELFVALPGVHVDGHRFVEAAVARGAAAVLCQNEPGDAPPVPHVVVPNTRAAMADLAAAYYGYPSDH